LIEIDDVQAPIPGVFVHRGRVVKGSWESGIEVLASIDVERRRGISRAHTATHMVHKAFLIFQPLELFQAALLMMLKPGLIHCCWMILK
ncbi:MAG: hypothetical protein RLZZ159_620, partial [Actinomycetota bacterium]